MSAPITGRVSRRDVTEGNLISGGTLQSTLLTTIVSLDPIHCYFDADEQAFLKYTRLAMEGKRQSSRDVKNPVYLALADEDTRLSAQGPHGLRRQPLGPQHRHDARPGHFCKSGSFAHARSLRAGAAAGQRRYEAVLVPDSAIGNDQSEKFVLVVDSDNKVRRQVVEIGPTVERTSRHSQGT